MFVPITVCGRFFVFKPLNTLFFLGPSSFTSLSLLGSRSIMSFEGICGGNGSNRLFFCPFNSEDNGDKNLEVISITLKIRGV